MFSGITIAGPAQGALHGGALSVFHPGALLLAHQNPLRQPSSWSVALWVRPQFSRKGYCLFGNRLFSVCLHQNAGCADSAPDFSSASGDGGPRDDLPSGIRASARSDCGFGVLLHNYIPKGGAVGGGDAARDTPYARWTCQRGPKDTARGASGYNSFYNNSAQDTATREYVSHVQEQFGSGIANELDDDCAFETGDFNRLFQRGEWVHLVVTFSCAEDPSWSYESDKNVEFDDVDTDYFQSG